MRSTGGATASGNPRMSHSDNPAADDGASAPIRDASLRIDPRSLSSDEKEFARLMGFAEEESAADSAPAPRKSAPRKSTPAVIPDESTDAEAKAAEAVAIVGFEATEPTMPIAASPSVDPVSGDTPGPAYASGAPSAGDRDRKEPPERTREWEEIHPRAAALGRQAALVERADRVEHFGSDAGSTLAGDAAAGRMDVDAKHDAGKPVDVAALRARLAASERRIAELEATASGLDAALGEKERELAMRAKRSSSEEKADGLQLELEALIQERDGLGDALAAANTARAEAQARVERLEAALRAVRGPSGPVPDGERELRAEVIGLRRRLEERGEECRRLRETLDERTTELEIARAHRDDRQSEIDQIHERIESLERERASTIERLDEALSRQRELLALAARVQSENVELRSTQAALEETLEARDLEISAREEHLAVTRRGLATRDEQLQGASERLEQARHRHELLEAELDRARLAQNELEQKLLRRDARIASLATTLARIEDAIGRTVTRPGPDAAAPPPARTGPEPTEMPQLAPADLEPITPVRATAAEGCPAELVPDPHDAITMIPPASLPPVLSAWRNEKLRVLLGAQTDLAGYLARHLIERFADAIPQPIRILSLGGADPAAEIDLARALMALGVGALSIAVIEADAAGAEARREIVESAGLASSISIGRFADLAATPQAAVHALLLCDALFGQPRPDAILGRLAKRLAPDGIVLFADRIAGGALRISDATQEKLAELWDVLPESWTSQPAFAAAPRPGDDGGVAAPEADLRSALDHHFTPLVTIGLGHLADLAIGPARGFLVSDFGSAAEAFLTSIDALDESRSIAESLPPRQGVAVWIRREAASIGTAPERFGVPWPDLSDLR